MQDKSRLDLEKMEHEIKEDWFDRLKLHTNSFANWYYPVKPKVYVEEFIEEADDYDVMCFHGEPKLLIVKTGHFIDGVNMDLSYPRSFYTTDWEYMDAGYRNMQRRADLEKPPHLKDMLEISRRLSKDFPFIRVDFYENRGKLYLAEFAFTTSAGLRPYEPESLDYEMGKWLDIVHTAKPEYVDKGR